MKYFIKNNWLYFFLYFVTFTYAIYYLIQFDKVALHVKINELVGIYFVDNFFKYFTHIGDGLFTLFIGIIFLLFNIRGGIFVLLTYITSGLITSVLKNYFFDTVNRPHFVFDYFVKHIKIHYVEGVDMLGQNSFPSGHATSAFALFTCLALLVKKKHLKVIFFIIALLAAFSRTYLSQHWLVDITFGSLIGVCCAMFFYFAILNNPSLKKMDRPLFERNKK